MIEVGKYNRLKVLRKKPMGLFLEGADEGILLPNRYVPKDTRIGDEIEVFLYHDSEDRLIATTKRPYGCVDEVRLLKAVSVTEIGAFLDLGLPKDLFLPKKKMRHFIRVGGFYLVRIEVDEMTGRMNATEYIESGLNNETLNVNVRDEVDLTAYRKTQIGFEMIINNHGRGMLHFDEIFQPIKIGSHYPGFIKKIFKHEGTGEILIDLVLGKPGYGRINDDAEKVLALLKEEGGYLPYYDKSSPEDIYHVFKMSKKAFKMAIGHLYKNKVIVLTKSGIKLIHQG